MKKLIITSLLTLMFFACKKTDVHQKTTNSYLHMVLAHLRDSVSIKEFSSLDTTQPYLTKSSQSGYWSLRLPFAGKPIKEDFLLLRTDTIGHILSGRIVHLNNSSNPNPQSPAIPQDVSLSALSGKTILKSTITNGFIDALHPQEASGRQLKDVDSRTITVLPAPDADWLPEVVVVGYGGGAPPTPYISLDALLGGVGNGDLGVNAGGGQADPGTGSGGSGSGNGSSGTTAPPSDPAPAPYAPVDPTFPSLSHNLGGPTSQAYDLEPEYIFGLQVIDIRKYFNCFDQVPSAGATYSVQLCADLPINNNPNASMNFSGVNAGHTFLVVTKANSGVSITQAFGYYPQSKPSILNPFAPIPGVIKNNGTQEINGAISMSLTADQFNILKTNAITLSSKPYVLDASNCTDYALNVFNSVRATPIVLSPYIVNEPGIIMSGAPASNGFTVTVTNSPQQLFQKLTQMKANNAESSNIQLDLSHNFMSPASHGECN